MIGYSRSSYSRYTVGLGTVECTVAMVTVGVRWAMVLSVHGQSTVGIR